MYVARLNLLPYGERKGMRDWRPSSGKLGTYQAQGFVHKYKHSEWCCNSLKSCLILGMNYIFVCRSQFCTQQEYQPATPLNKLNILSGFLCLPNFDSNWTKSYWSTFDTAQCEYLQSFHRNKEYFFIFPILWCFSFSVQTKYMILSWFRTEYQAI